MMNKSVATRAVPFVLFIVLSFLLFLGLHNDPQKIPSALIDQPMPTFSLKQLDEEKPALSDKNLLGHLTLLNVWATWCVVCEKEQPVLLDITNLHRVNMVGLEYKDDRVLAKQWLAKFGNPFQTILFDGDGQASINWGVYGTPETFLIDKAGIIRYKHVGELTVNVWNDEIEPLVRKYS